MTKIGVLLSGCGFLDGSEIHESVLTLLHLSRASAIAVCIAARGVQAEVVDHSTGKAMVGQTRDMLVESARIARGEIRDLSSITAEELDGLILPGGFGAAKNLCDFARAQARATVRPDVQNLLRSVHQQHKPIGAICIAPAVLAAAIGHAIHPTLTIGKDAGTASALTAMGAKHQDCEVREFCVDRQNRLVSTPAYMFHASVADVSAGIEKLVQAVLEMAREPRPMHAKVQPQ